MYVIFIKGEQTMNFIKKYEKSAFYQEIHYETYT